MELSKISKELLNMLTEFVISEIGANALDGITYSMALKNDKDKALCERCLAIRKQATKEGLSPKEVFRLYDVPNGYIFDMDINTVKIITAELIKNVKANNKNIVCDRDIIKDMPEQRRKRDLVLISKYLQSEYDKGNLSTEVALFSRNTTDRILVSGKGNNGENLVVKYKAYAIRPWDIELVNEKFLIPAGFRVKSIQPCEVLPSKTGVSFIFSMERYSNEDNRQW